MQRAFFIGFLTCRYNKLAEQMGRWHLFRPKPNTPSVLIARGLYHRKVVGTQRRVLPLDKIKLTGIQHTKEEPWRRE
jgi:hypothetical protein